MADNRNDKGIRLLIRVLFFVFSFVYLFVFQGAILENTLLSFDSMASGLTRTLFFAIIFSIAVTLVEIPMEKILKYSGRFYACNYIPSSLLLGLGLFFCFDDWKMGSLIKPIFLIVIVILFMAICKILSVRSSKKDILGDILANNFLILTLSMGITFVMGNTDETLHRSMKMRQLYNESKYEQVLLIGRGAEEINTEISILRAKSLSALPYEKVTGSQLGERLFDYRQQNVSVVADSLMKSEMKDSIEYSNRILSASLLKKNLSAFVNELMRTADSSIVISSWEPQSMPKYYMQALILAENHNIQVPDELHSLYRNQYQEELAHFQSYQNEKDLVNSEPLQYQSNYMYKKFFRTYWWFYDFFKD